jgi:hypothetical protein
VKTPAFALGDVCTGRNPHSRNLDPGPQTYFVFYNPGAGMSVAYRWKATSKHESAMNFRSAAMRDDVRVSVRPRFRESQIGSLPPSSIAVSARCPDFFHASFPVDIRRVARARRFTAA